MKRLAIFLVYEEDESSSDTLSCVEVCLVYCEHEAEGTSIILNHYWNDCSDPEAQYEDTEAMCEDKGLYTRFVSWMDDFILRGARMCKRTS